MAIGEFQPIDLLGMQGGLGNLPTAANVQALGNQQAAAAAGIEGLQARAMAERAQAQAAQQQQVRAQQFQDALHAHFQDGSPQSASRLMLQFPEYAKQFKDAHDMESSDVREADTQFKSDVYSRANAGDWKAAAAVALKRLDAAKAAGHNTSDEQSLYDHLISNDPVQQKMALGVLSYDLATAVGPEKWAAFAGSDKPTVIGQGGVAIDKDGKVLYENVNEGHAVRVKGQPDQWGNATPDTWVNSVTGELMEGPGAAAPAAGGAPSGGNVVDAIIGAEGTGKNPNSSAVGVGQFVDDTWVEQFKSKYPNTTLSVPEILKLKSNPKLARDLTAQYAEANTAKLGAAGVATDAPSVYLAHFLGPQDAIDVLRADPSTPVANLVAPASIAANKSVLAGKTAGEVKAWAASKVGGAAGGETGAGPFGMPADATGETAMAAIPKQYQARVQQLLNGEGAPIRITARSTPIERQIAYALPMIDPTYSDATFQQRAAMRKDVFSGVTSKNIKSINTLMGHLGTLSDLAEKRKAADLRYGNKIGGWFATQAGKDYVTNMKLAQQAVADEMENAFTGGGGGTEAGRHGWQASFSPDSSPAQIRGAIATALHLTGSRITAIKDLWRAGMGPKTPDLKILSPSAAAAYNRIAATSGPPPEVVAALARAGLK